MMQEKLERLEEGILGDLGRQVKNAIYDDDNLGKQIIELIKTVITTMLNADGHTPPCFWGNKMLVFGQLLDKLFVLGNLWANYQFLGNFWVNYLFLATFG